MHTYILDGHTPVPVDVLTWGAWMEDFEQRVVGRTAVAEGVDVSTVFLGMNLQFGEGPPLLFETMVRWEDGPLNQEQERYPTWAEAEQGHARMVARVRDAIKDLLEGEHGH
jgi:hypothetical protein